MDGKVLILLATYNGEKYIKEQIASILKQTYTNWELCISDDGSSDCTCDIINEIRINEKRILPILKDNQKHGACTNFYHLLRFAKEHLSEYDFFCLSDQDDIWEYEKIEKQVNRMRNGYGSILCYSDLRIIDQDGKLHERMSEIQPIKLINPADIFFNQIYIWGNTIMINKRILEESSFPLDIGNELSHDHYLAFQAVSCGKVEYIEEPLVRYRRTTDNVSDMPHKYNFFTAIKRAAEIRKLIDLHAQNYNNILYFIKKCKRKSAFLDDIGRCYSQGGLEAIKIIRKYRIHIGSNKYNKMLRMIILFSGVYKISRFYKAGEETT